MKLNSFDSYALKQWSMFLHNAKVLGLKNEVLVDLINCFHTPVLKKSISLFTVVYI